MADEDGSNMGEFFGAQPYAARIVAAFDWPHAAEPGARWVYHTGDTFILTRALHNYLQAREGPEADIFQFVVDEVYRRSDSALGRTPPCAPPTMAGRGRPRAAMACGGFPMTSPRLPPC